MVADLGCKTGFYAFASADCVGSEGRVYAVDLNEEYIRALEKKRALPEFILQIRWFTLGLA